MLYSMNALTEAEEDCVNGHIVDRKEKGSNSPSTNNTNLKTLIMKW